MKSFSALSLAASLVLALAADNSAHKCTSIEVRKEWRALTKTERKAWIDAVNCLSKVPRSRKLDPPINTTSYPEIYDQIAPVTENSTYYDDLVYTHMNLNRMLFHTFQIGEDLKLIILQLLFILLGSSFLGTGYTSMGGLTPSVPNVDTEVSRLVSVANWAWEKDAADFENSTMWDTDTESGIGGFGDPDDDWVVKTGGLDLTLAYPIPHKLRREYRPYLSFGGVLANTTFSPAEVDKLLAQPEGNFTAFQDYTEKIIGMHSAIHAILGGDMAGLCPKGSSNTSVCPTEGAPTFSANEPMFHLHHGNIDRLWWLWQEKSDINKAAFHGGSIQNMSALDVYPNGQAPWLNKSSPIPTAGMCGSD
ncbi:hypothetical protein CTheo_8261 [Ceratobasidium theobromae]|uniref:Tyrosinase copper-binding domain-containing protein n=1 Tax=Ceratobasidium theobromae TaxID=1582974 RepID=A0A5N5QA62_9AGAM|nr:hypothetical protein CTheo_8261 [Ceratobasidium theobromae]